MEFIDKYFLKLNYSGWFFFPLTYRLWGRNSWDSKAANTILRPGDIYPWQLSWSCSVQYFVVLPWLPQSPRLVGWSAFWARGEHCSQAAPTAVASCREPSGCSVFLLQPHVLSQTQRAGILSEGSCNALRSAHNIQFYWESNFTVGWQNLWANDR